MTDYGSEHAALALRLTRHGFAGSERFLRVHSAAVRVVDAVLDYYEQLDDRAYARLYNPGAVIRTTIHEEIADEDGSCPYCPWRASGAVGATTRDG